MYIAVVPMRPTSAPKHRVPKHVPDVGSGFILLSVVVLLMAAVWKRFGLSKAPARFPVA
jgi:hypothetical protein